MVVPLLIATPVTSHMYTALRIKSPFLRHLLLHMLDIIRQDAYMRPILRLTRRMSRRPGRTYAWARTAGRAAVLL